MSTAASSGVGFQMLRDSVAIAEVRSVNRSGRERSMLEATDLDSTGGYRVWIPSFRDGGEFTLEVYWTPTGYNTFNDDFESDTEVTWQAVFPDAGNFTIEFNGYVRMIDGPAVTFDDVMTMTIAIKVTGQDTITT